MSTNKLSLREQALTWWNNLPEIERTEYFKGYTEFTPATHHSQLTGREIQNIWAVAMNPATPAPQEQGKHTPGDWVIDGDLIIGNVNEKTYDGTGGFVVCEIHPETEYITSPKKWELGDKQLIASAPRLLAENESLKEQVRVLREALRVVSNGISIHQSNFDEENSEWGILEDLLTDISAALKQTTPKQ